MASSFFLSFFLSISLCLLHVLVGVKCNKSGLEVLFLLLYYTYTGWDILVIPKIHVCITRLNNTFDKKK